MKTKNLYMPLAACIAIAVWGTALAEEPDTEGDSSASAKTEGEGLTSAGQEAQADKLAERYADTFGGEDNARSVAEKNIHSTIGWYLRRGPGTTEVIEKSLTLIGSDFSPAVCDKSDFK